jgi:hypothetical protein
MVSIKADCEACNVRYIIGSCNANAVKDDGFHVDMDGTYIGDINLDTNAAQSVLIIPQSYILAGATLTDPALFNGCSGLLRYLGSTYLDTVIFAGAHTLTFTCYVLNGSNSAFNIYVQKVKLIGTSVTPVGSPQNLTSISGTFSVGDVVTRSVVVCP